MDKSYIDDAFQLWWPKLKLVIDNIPKSIPPDVKTDSRSEREIMEETLSLVRKLSRELRPTTPRRAYNTPNDMPPPPDNFPDDWDEMWQPSFEETVIRSTPKPKPKTNK